MPTSGRLHDHAASASVLPVWLLLIPLWLLLVVLAVGFVLRLLFPLPRRQEPPRLPLPELPEGQGTRLSGALRHLVRLHSGLSGILPLSEAGAALAARMLLLRAADRSVDLQYYIWQGDFSGRLLLEELRAAADRGVRVRLLLDDNGTWGLDRELAQLDAHPGIEVRLFNPFTIRRPKAIGYAMDPWRLNRRMHNKSMTVDNAATIVGGRNIGDEYFGIGENSQFADLDVVAVGSIVAEVTADFERYWEAEASYPLTQFLKAAAGRSEVRPKGGSLASKLARDHRRELAASPLAGLAAGRPPVFEWARVRIVSDDPAKALGRVRQGGLLIDKLFPVMGNPARCLSLVSPYFVPTARGRDELVALAGAGVEVTVLTNALDSTNQALVHAGYAKHRRRLLQGGVRLFELKGDGKADLSVGASASKPMARPAIRSGATSLHAKTFSADRKMFFVGSFNFDPRSALLNTELGFVIESGVLAGRLQELLEGPVAGIAYEVRLSGRHLLWVEQTTDGEQIYHHEPHTGPLQRAIIVGLSWLPIDWLL